MRRRSWGLGMVMAGAMAVVGWGQAVFAAGTPADTNITATATAEYADSNNNKKTTNEASKTIVVQQVAGLDVTPSTATDTTKKTEEVDYALTITNNGNGADTFNLGVAFTGLANKIDIDVTSDASGWTSAIYHDADGDGQLDADEKTAGTIASISDLAADGTYKVIVAVTPDAANAKDADQVKATLTATSVFNGAVSDTADMTTTISDVALKLTITVDNDNPQPGDSVTYTYTLENTGTGTATNVEDRVQIPTNTTYEANSTKFVDGGTSTDKTDDSADNDGVAFDGSAKKLTVHPGDIIGGASKVWTFQVKVDDFVDPDTSICPVNAGGADADFTDTTNTIQPLDSPTTPCVTVATLYKFNLAYKSATDETPSPTPGDGVDAPFNLHNLGNVSDTYVITLTWSESTFAWAVYPADSSYTKSSDTPLQTGTGTTASFTTSSIAKDGVSYYVLEMTTPGDATDGTTDALTVGAKSTGDTTVTHSLSLNTTVMAPNISLAMGVDNDKPVPGNTLTWTVTATNNGTLSAATVVLTTPIPNATSYVAGSIKAGADSANLVALTDTQDDGSYTVSLQDSSGTAVAADSGNVAKIVITRKTTFLGAGATWLVQFQSKVD